MAGSLRPNLSSSFFSQSPKPPSPSQARSSVPIRCGPRDNRGPLLKGRVLSIEAIHAVQSLKRAHRRSDPSHLRNLISGAAARLIKSDLIAALNELLRQDHCDLAVDLLSAARSEPWYRTDLGVYGGVAAALARNGLGEDLDRLIRDLEGEGGGVISCDNRGLTRLLRAVIAAGRVESTVRIYGMMRRSGWGTTSWVGDEYVVKVLSKALRRFGKEEVADEVVKEFETASRASLVI